MTSSSSDDPNQPIESLLARIEAIGHHEKTMINQLQELGQQAQTLFDETGQVRKDLIALKTDLATQTATQAASPKATSKVPDAPTPVTPVAQPLPVNPPKASAAKADKGQWELTLGIKWFSRIGIIALLIGVALGLNYTLPHVSSQIKLLLGGLSAVGLFLLGTKLHEKMTILGRVLQAGGLSLGYVTLFAMFFFPSMAIVHNATAGYITLAAYVALTMGVAHRIRSQIAALLSLGFGYYTASFCGDAHIAYIATTGLSVAALGMSWLNQEWRWIPRACVVGYLGTLEYWYHMPYAWHLPHPLHQPAEQAWILSYLWINMALFHVASLLPHRREDALLNILNSLGFYGTITAVTAVPMAAGALEGLLCLIQMASVAIFRLRPDKTHTSNLYTSFLWLGLGYLGLATCAHFSETTQTMVLALEALVIGLAARVPGSSKHLRLASVIFWTVGALTSIGMAFTHSGGGMEWPIVLSAFAIALVGVLSESFVYPAWDKAFRVFILALSNMLMLQVVWLEVPSQWITVTEIGVGLVLLTLGFVVNQKKHRWMGLCWLALAVLHILFVDIATLAPVYKVIMFLVFGGGLLGASFGYNVLAQKDEKSAHG